MLQRISRIYLLGTSSCCPPEPLDWIGRSWVWPHQSTCGILSIFLRKCSGWFQEGGYLVSSLTFALTYRICDCSSRRWCFHICHTLTVWWKNACYLPGHGCFPLGRLEISTIDILVLASDGRRWNESSIVYPVSIFQDSKIFQLFYLEPW